MNFKKRRHIDCWNHDWKDKKKEGKCCCQRAFLLLNTIVGARLCAIPALPVEEFVQERLPCFLPELFQLFFYR